MGESPVREPVRLAAKEWRSPFSGFLQNCLERLYRLSYLFKKTVAKNYFIPACIKKTKRGEWKITILHQRNHWTQYLEGLLTTDPRFILRRSLYSEGGAETAPPFRFYDPETMDIVTGGLGCFGNTLLTRWHRILVRVQHSPGWGMETFVWVYHWTKSNGFRLMIPKYCWDLILKTDNFKEDILRKRDQILKDGTPIVFTHFDPKLNRIFNHPKTAKRQPGTALISCNWRIAAKSTDTELLVKAIQFLAKKVEVTINLHPNTLTPPQYIEQPAAGFLAALKNTNAIKIVTQDSTEDMIRLYDSHEFIVTDGSGAAYEAAARGCKALTLDGLSYQANKDVFHCTAELGLLPKTLVWNYENHPGNQAEMEWLKTLYPTSIVKEDVTSFVAQEIRDVFDQW